MNNLCALVKKYSTVNLIFTLRSADVQVTLGKTETYITYILSEFAEEYMKLGLEVNKYKKRLFGSKWQRPQRRVRNKVIITMSNLGVITTTDGDSNQEIESRAVANETVE